MESDTEEEMMPTEDDWDNDTTTLAAEDLSLANIKVTESRDTEGVENVVGPVFQEHMKFSLKDKGKKKKSVSSRRRAKRKPQGTKLLQEAIITLFPDCRDPAEAMRRAKSMITQTISPEDLFYEDGKNARTTMGTEKIGPGNDHDDLPVFVKGIVDFVAIPEFENVKLLVAKRRNDDSYIAAVNAQKLREQRQKQVYGMSGSFGYYSYSDKKNPMSQDSQILFFPNKEK